MRKLTFVLLAFLIALVTRVSLAGLLPDFMTLAQFEAVLTTAQLTQLNAAALKTSHPVIYNAWQAVQANGGYDMEDPNAQTLASQALSLGFITQAQYTTLTTPIVTAPGP